MGCLFRCFGSSEDGKRQNCRNIGSPRRQRNGGQIPLQSTVFTVLDTAEKATNLVPELSETSEEQLSLSTRKRVTFDSNVGTHKHVTVIGSTDSLTHKHVTVIGSTDSLLENKENNSEREKEEGFAKSGQPHTNAEDDSTTSSFGSYPQNHRYQNCQDSDDGAVESVYEDSLSTRKRVTFDSNVKTYEHVTAFGSSDSILENNNNNREREREEGLAKSRQSHINSEDDSTASSVGSYPQNHRYQNCRDSDDEAVESEYEESDLDDEDDEFDDGSLLCQEVWSETIPTASMEPRTEFSLPRVASEEVDSPIICCGLPEQEGKTVGLNQNIRNRSDYPVLNAVENLSQWKAVKSKGTLLLKPQQKENSAAAEEAPRISFSSEPRFKQPSFSFKPQSHHQAKNLKKDVAVDASLSNWLVSSETTPKKKISSTALGTITSEESMSQGSTSVRSIEDRPILGALTLEELKQFLTSSSPRKSPSRSPDEMPIIGTVGTYWNHTGEATDSGSASSYKTKDLGSASSYKGIPNTTSKYREDKKVNWHSSTPFETRLERALKSGAA